MGKKKTIHSSPTHLYEMAQRLNLERRLHPRVKLPRFASEDFCGPKVFFESHFIQLVDMSEGGVCLLDQEERVQARAGNDFNLTVSVGDHQDQVECRMVAMNLARRHVQFLNPPHQLILLLRDWIQTALRGQWLKVMSSPSAHKNQPILWTSIYDDNLIWSQDPRWKYQLCVGEQNLNLSPNLRPVRSDTLKPISMEEYDRLLIFLENLSFSDEHSQTLIESLSHHRKREND